MQQRQWKLIGINAAGGAAVLGTYGWGFLAQPETMGALWGGVPESLRGLYTANMFLAAFGYFLFTPYIVFRSMSESRPTRRTGSPYSWLYVAILIPSALWLPLTYLMVHDPSAWLWWLIRIDLALVGIGSAGLLLSLSLLSHEEREKGHQWAVVGLLPFCLQTVILDAIVWPIYF